MDHDGHGVDGQLATSCVHNFFFVFALKSGPTFWVDSRLKRRDKLDFYGLEGPTIDFDVRICNRVPEEKSYKWTRQ